MPKKSYIFNVSAEQNAHFVNPDAHMIHFDSEDKPAQRALTFTDMFQDISESAPLFIQHLVQINTQVYGEQRTLEGLKEIALRPNSSEYLAERIDTFDLKEASAYLGQLYRLKTEAIKASYVTAETILDEWTASYKSTAKLYDFPAFQDYYLKHPLNLNREPLEKDNGSDDSFSIEGSLFRICIKSPYSAFSKIFSDYKSPDTPDTPFHKEFLTDLQRARIASADSQIHDFIRAASHHNPRSAIHDNSAQNIGATLEDNRLIAPKKMTGHRVFFQKFALPTSSTERGSIVELQILPQSIMNVNDITHILMDKADELLNVSEATLEERIEANFLYNLCNLIHKECAEMGGFQKLVGEGFEPETNILNMMKADQRQVVNTHAHIIQGTVTTILNRIKNGKDYSNQTTELLNQAHNAATKSVAIWRQAEEPLNQIFETLDKRIEALTNNQQKHSSKDYREATILQDAKRLLYEQVMDTNMFPELKPSPIRLTDTRPLYSILVSAPELSEYVESLVSVIEEQAINTVLGHKPNAAPIISYSLGLANHECRKHAPDNKALSQALNKSAAITSKTALYDDEAPINDRKHYSSILNSRKHIDFYGNALARRKNDSDSFIGVQEDIFGNVNFAVQYKSGALKRLDLNQLQAKFVHSYEKLKTPRIDVPTPIRRMISGEIQNLSEQKNTKQVDHAVNSDHLPKHGLS